MKATASVLGKEAARLANLTAKEAFLPNGGLPTKIKPVGASSASVSVLGGDQDRKSAASTPSAWGAKSKARLPSGSKEEKAPAPAEGSIQTASRSRPPMASVKAARAASRQVRATSGLVRN